MYEELVATIRRQCVEMDCGNCNTCVKRKAADAIEELSQKVDEWQEEACKWNSEYYHLLDNTPRWISVEERLPEDGEEVLCYYEYFRYGRFNCMYKTVDRGYFLNGHFGGEPTNGQKAKVLYWMPLPEPPKEG